MADFDIDTLMLEVDAAAPCGPNLEYDPAFVALEQAVLGKQEVQYGKTISAAEPPDWKSIRRSAGELLARSRDLRLVVHLLRANLSLHGIDGLAEGVRLIEGLLEERWDSVHPQLDADDGMDPMLRINTLAILSDKATLLKDLKEAPLIVLPVLGPLTLRMLEIATGELAMPDGPGKIPLASIELALADVDTPSLGRAVAALMQAFDSVTNIEALLVRQAGSAKALNLEVLTRALKRGRDFLAQQLEKRPAAVEAGGTADGAVAGVAGAADAQGRAGAGAGPAPISGEIAGRADVLLMLDKLIKYYREHEPSSPLPLLLVRARGLVNKNFIEIMEDLAPAGVAQLLVVSGPEGGKQDGK
jgi:type VI secretion system protein ImpA